MDGSQPGGYTTRVQIPGSTVLTTAPKTLATINRLARHATASNVSIQMPFDYAASNAVVALVRVNGALKQILQLPAGNGSALIHITDAPDPTSVITIENANGVTIFNNGVAGFLSYRADYGGATV